MPAFHGILAVLKRCCGCLLGYNGCCFLSSALVASCFHPDGDCHDEKRNDFEAGCQGSIEDS